MCHQHWISLTILATLCLHVGSERCNRYEKKCPGDVCVDAWDDCPKCPDPRDVPCPDGTCVAFGNSCFFKGCMITEKKCPDGRCVATTTKCSDGCAYNEKKCDRGHCISLDRFCHEEPCPSNKTERCGNGDCYARHEACNSAPYCLDSSDEKDCMFNLQKILDTPWLVVIISVIIFALFCLIIALCCRYRHNEDRRTKARRDRSRQHHPANYEEMPAVAGRRMPPVSPAHQPSVPGGPGGPGQPVPTGADPRSPITQSSTAPSPYNPELIPFIVPGQFGSSPLGYNHPQSGTPQQTQPSAPPLGLEAHLAPPPYHEALNDAIAEQQQPYLPSYETVQRSDSSGNPAV